MNYKKQACMELAEELARKGFEVWLSGNKEYGFFTDEYGQTIVTFQFGLGAAPEFSGNVSNGGRSHGSGWRMEANTIDDAWFQSKYPPSWYSQGYKGVLKMQTREGHLKIYGSSSKYEKFEL